MNHYRLLAMGLTLFWSVGCASLHQQLQPRKVVMNRLPPPAYWIGDEVKGPPAIVISLTEQRAYFYKGKKMVGESKISSGKNGYDTPPGSYKITQKDLKHVSNLYGNYVNADGAVVRRNVDTSKDPIPEGAVFSGAKMPYFMRFSQGYGLHAGFLPGYRASHGCIRMPAEMADHFFKNSEPGTPVTVQE